jgi:2-C-methyl-D-erythritol 4-phosphate cytidylyltransferase / 2-C-methyl-D-erythritol 2,4-cyclodiphosphate synthase
VTDAQQAAALIVAAGRGARAAGPGGLPKQYQDLGGHSVLARTLAAFATHPGIGLIQVVIHPEDGDAYTGVARPFGDRLSPPVYGGATRQASVLSGLKALTGLAPPSSPVLIHDAARPFVSTGIIDRVLEALGVADGALPALPIVDTLRRASPDQRLLETVDRDRLYRAQTPQGFRLDAILAAHEGAANAGRHDFTDDAAVAQWAGLDVRLVTGEERNVKLTTAEDMALASRSLAAAPGETRMATGFDVHRFRDGDHVWLCGIKVPHVQGLEGHSDADVGLHALTDALLGAIGDGDIGQHFPPSDPQWRGAASHIFLADAARRVEALGGRIVNVDVTLLCEVPRIAPHRTAMQARIAAVLGIPSSRVSVKATTTEGLGFTGRREGIAAQAAAAVWLPLRPADCPG